MKSVDDVWFTGTTVMEFARVKFAVWQAKKIKKKKIQGKSSVLPDIA